MPATSESALGGVVLQERVDDIPILFALAVRLKLPELLEKHLGTHGNHKGLGNGWLCTLWLVYILSQSDHRKSPVEQWVERHRECLSRLLGREVSAKEFNDDRLGAVLGRLSKPQVWEALEEALWASSAAVYELKVDAVRLDSTSSYDSGFCRVGRHSGKSSISVDSSGAWRKSACAYSSGRVSRPREASEASEFEAF